MTHHQSPPTLVEGANADAVIKARLRMQYRTGYNTAIEQAAATAYRTCAETRHVTLGDKAAEAIRELANNAEDGIDAPPPGPNVEPFQARVQPWMMACFGEMIAGDREERNHRFLEEALELVQSAGCTESEAHQLVDYVYGRPIGEPHQEVGGVMVTLAALCLANALDMHEAGETELARVWTKVEAIRAKQAAKPKYSPLPGATGAEGRHNG